MADERADDLYDERILRRRTRRTGEAVSHLCRSWINAGADALIGGLRIAANAAEDLSESGCRPARRPPDGNE
jgi:hypothetical protein